MSSLFFFSYASNSDSPYLRQFFEELCKEVKERIRWNGDVGFLDQRNVPLGAPWDNNLREALQTSKVLVCVYAPPYFQSEYCGREWQVFQLRMEQYTKDAKAAGHENPTPPSVIKPVIWLPTKEQQLPEPVRSLQYKVDGEDALHNKLGLQLMTRQRTGKFESEYIAFLGSFAQQIVDAAEIELPPADLSQYENFESVPNAFDRPRKVAVQEAVPPNVDPQRPELVVTKPRSLGPNFVQFVFVAGSPAEFMKEELMDEAEKPYVRSQIESYLENGGRDWKPFYPMMSTRIRPVVAGLASGSGLELDVDELECDERLADNVRDANDSRSLVIILADSWTLGLQKYRSILENFDRNLYKNCSVLIPWNENDPEFTPLTAEERARLEGNLRRNVSRSFPNWSSVTKPLYFYSIRTASELNLKLVETLKALRESFINETMNNPTITIPKPIESAINKPSISSKPEGQASDSQGAR